MDWTEVRIQFLVAFFTRDHGHKTLATNRLQDTQRREILVDMTPARDGHRNILSSRVVSHSSMPRCLIKTFRSTFTMVTWIDEVCQNRSPRELTAGDTTKITSYLGTSVLAYKADRFTLVGCDGRMLDMHGDLIVGTKVIDKLFFKGFKGCTVSGSGDYELVQLLLAALMEEVECGKLDLQDAKGIHTHLKELALPQPLSKLVFATSKGVLVFQIADKLVRASINMDGDLEVREMDAQWDTIVYAGTGGEISYRAFCDQKRPVSLEENVKLLATSIRASFTLDGCGEAISISVITDEQVSDKTWQTACQYLSEVAGDNDWFICVHSGVGELMLEASKF